MSKPIRIPRDGTRSSQSSDPAIYNFMTPQVLVAIVIIGTIILGVMLQLWFQGSGTASAQPTPIPVLAGISTTPLSTLTGISVTPTASCTPAGTYLDVIISQEQAGQYDLAASTAALALRNQGLCDSDRTSIASKAVADGLEAIQTEPFSPHDLQAQQAQADRFLALRQQAKQYNVAFPTDLQVAQRAYSGGKFLLAQVAFDESFRSGRVTTTSDRELVRQYCSTLFNLGTWWVEAGGNTRANGLRLLVASAEIDQRFRLGSGEASGSLLKILGPDTNWPPPADTPLLDAR